MFMSLRSWFRRELIERGRLQIKPFGARYLGAIFSALLLRVLPNPQNFYLLGICWVCSCLPVPITGVLVLPLLFLAWTLKWTFLSPTSKQSKQRGTRGKRKICLLYSVLETMETIDTEIYRECADLTLTLNSLSSLNWLHYLHRIFNIKLFNMIYNTLWACLVAQW